MESPSRELTCHLLQAVDVLSESSVEGVQELAEMLNRQRTAGQARERDLEATLQSALDAARGATLRAACEQEALAAELRWFEAG